MFEILKNKFLKKITELHKIVMSSKVSNYNFV